MRRARTLGIVAPLADVDTLASFERFINHEFHGPDQFHKSFN